MGDPTGFMNYGRKLGPDRDPAHRIGDWDEFHGHLPEKELATQGARCMDCGVPFCQTGQIIGGMTAGCPINNLIPCLLYTSPSPRDRTRSRMPSSA